MLKIIIRCLSIYVLGTWLSAGNAFAVEVLPGKLTSMIGASERIISYRNQQHMWETQDGAHHVFINRGLDADTGDLMLFTRASDGTWAKALTLYGTNRTSTLDGVLIYDSLHICYSTTSGAILYATIDYNPAQENWSVSGNGIVDSGTDALGSVPSIAVDGAARTWCSYTRRDNGTQRTQIALRYSTDGGGSWNESGQRFASNNVLRAKASRLVQASDGIGMVFTNSTLPEELKVATGYWAYLANTQSPTDQWETETLWTFPLNENAGKDPYGTHYSAIGDAVGNVHLLYVDKGILKYRRYDGVAKTWSKVNELSSNAQVAYTQLAISRADGSLYAIYNHFNQLTVLRSNDGGQNFAYAVILRRPNGSDTLDVSRPRIETPAAVSDMLPVLSQLSYRISPTKEVELLLSHQYSLF